MKRYNFLKYKDRELYEMFLEIDSYDDSQSDSKIIKCRGVDVSKTLFMHA